MVELQAWGPGDLPLLQRLLGDPAMMEHLGGPESQEKIADRQRRYEADPGCLKIVADGEELGWVGYWDREWRGGSVYEIGWAVLPEAQGRGVATQATRLAIETSRATSRHRWLHAFPGVDNPPSNAICRKLGFTLLEARDFEYPPGTVMRCNDWRLDLAAHATAPDPRTPTS
jgi:RimJ/RimL family protein N-acetyltransferase